jgi:cytochrome c551/c552
MKLTNNFTMRISLMLVVAAGLLIISTPVSAGAFSTSACKACHAVGKDGVGPDWKVVAERYGDAKALAAVLKSGFKVEDRKVAQSTAKWKSQAGTMTGQYDALIKKGGNEEAAAEAVFAAVKEGRIR